ncbi:MAG: MFS transporter [Bacteroidia bacterium]|nr:MFS transporter [Bacteroidia bacterium]
MSRTNLKSPFNSIVIVAALGYFVDIYDLILFGIVRVPSLKAIGVPQEQLLDTGIYLLNMQMVGMLLGGIFWGILGDKKGRLSTLFGTIILYSLANIANGFVQTVPQYALMRFIAGVGLAGELGVGITLVSEVMAKESRGYGTMMVSGIGIAGAAFGFLVADSFNWQVAYWVGGGMGLVLLVLRFIVSESGMFQKIHKENISKGNFFMLFNSRKRFLKYLYCILIGVPVWFVIGILVIFSPEFAKKVFHIPEVIDGGRALMYHYIGASIGSFLTGYLSQHFRSRRKALAISMITLTFFIGVYFFSSGISETLFHILLFLLGIAQGYWAVFITTASELFGTNLRATATTTIPNFVRCSTVLMTLLFKYLKSDDVIGMLNAGIVVAIIVMTLALWALYKMEESYHKDLDYIEVK